MGVSWCQICFVSAVVAHLKLVMSLNLNTGNALCIEWSEKKGNYLFDVVRAFAFAINFFPLSSSSSWSFSSHFSHKYYPLGSILLRALAIHSYILYFSKRHNERKISRFALQKCVGSIPQASRHFWTF